MRPASLRVPPPGTAHSDATCPTPDFGHIVASRPLDVRTPHTGDELRDIVAFAGPRGIPVSARGGGYSMYGQGRAEGGYLIDMRALNAVQRTADERTLVAEAGARWRDVVQAALAEGFAPPVLPDHLGASVGGTLSTGGFGASSHRYGLVADAVSEVEVVTGTGEQVTCSRRRRPDLFDTVLAGLGQCALIVRATLRLVPAPALVRRYRLHYSLPGPYFADQRRLAHHDHFTHVSGQARPALDGAWDYVIDAVTPHTGQRPPDDAALTDGLRHDRDVEEIEDLSYAEFLYRMDRDERILRVTGEWERPHPWLTLLLPEAAAVSFVPAILADSGQQGLRTCGTVQLRPLGSDRLRAPMLRKPMGEDLCLVSLMRTAPPADADAVRQALAANRELYERARELGGTLHAVSAVQMTPRDWQAHFGPAWEGFARAKTQYDPHQILTRGYDLWP
ncbi:FAD-binding protein [Streptomyces sp. DG2A-72]|uniref:FAD-binding protein n=1 Tax=Streptomyces sp. DG2A-72 TaxID=3051386 RepID=UPI00265B7712|nr:FAD-binding protein [Streptomyces sp. DG2A-72]MDO0933476.1 FAD-binding protein [Streptomyces sp. DG2A-72]